MIDTTRINGNIYGWASVTVRIDGDLVNGLTAINWTETYESAMQYGLGKAYGPRGRTSPKFSCEASMEMPTDTAQKIRNKLSILAGGNGFATVSFDIVIQYSESLLSGQDPQTVTLIDCRIAKMDRPHGESTDALKESWDLSVMDVITNGQTGHAIASFF